MSEPRHPAEPYIERIVRLETEKAEIALNIREVYDEAKAAGLLKGALRIVVKEKLETDDQRETRETIEAEADQIRVSLGMAPGARQADMFDDDEAFPEEGPAPEPRRGRGRPRKAPADALAAAQAHLDGDSVH